MRPLYLVVALAACQPGVSPAVPAAPAAPAPTVSKLDPGAPDVSCKEPRFALPVHEDYSDGERRASSKDACEVADNNIAKDEAAILAERPTAAVKVTAWNHTTAPKFLDLVSRRFELHADELAALHKNGVVVPSRLAMPSYANAYHEIFQSQLPVYISADSIFHAIFASHDSVVAELEVTRLMPTLADAFATMQCTLGATYADYPPDVARDLDVYLLVGERLLTTEPKLFHSVFHDANVEREADALIAKIASASELETVELFGRPRVIDFTAYAPRGHYTVSEPLKSYFRAAMWASRLELNLVSRSSRSSAPGPEPDPRETPREAIAALALADLATRSGAAQPIADLDHAWAVLAGRREDVSIAQLAELRAQVGSLTAPDAFATLKAAIGDRYQRTTRIHPMPEGSTVLPAIATLIGPRIVADASALMPLVNSAIPGRDWVGVADIAYALGFDGAKLYLADERAKFPTLDAQLEIARDRVAKAPDSSDLYSAWLGAIRALARPGAGARPSFAATDVGRDLRLDTIAAAYGQLKHDYVLVAGQPYAEFGCEIPDGYVEAVPAAYDALIEYAKRGEQLAELVDPTRGTAVKDHFVRAGQVLRVLRTIAQDELAGRELTSAERRWLGQVAELDLDMGVDTTGHPPMYTGWYFDLFLDREGDGMRGAGFVADYFTGQQGVAYVGAGATELGVFVVDSNGPPRAFVGPVAHAFEARTPLGARLTDETAATARTEPWSKSYRVTPAAAIPTALSLDWEGTEIVLDSDHALGTATIKALDHHRVVIATKRISIGAGKTTVKLAAKRAKAIYLEIGGWRDFVVADGYGQIRAAWGAAKPVDE